MKQKAVFLLILEVISFDYVVEEAETRQEKGNITNKKKIQFIQKYPTRCNSVSTFIIPCLYEAQHVSGDTPPIIRSLKLH
jgi:hypothetical protein